MVIVRLMGGLGNQMFQYAAGRALAIRLRTELKMDRSYLDGPQTGNTRRRYELSALNIEERFAGRREAEELRGQGENRWRTALLRLRQASGLTKLHPGLLRERHFHFNPEYLAAASDVYLEGWWQSEKYFVEAADAIRREFTIRRPLDDPDLDLLREIEAGESVSVHVRGGDYVHRPETRCFHGVCGADYYARCMELASARLRDPRFFVITDDPRWARENIGASPRVTFVDRGSPRAGSADLELMRRCRHNIIANSSFGWWGAWLNENRGKLVIAPAGWFNAAEMDTRDLLPESWVRI